jgi:hypothetical protein
MEDGNWWTDRVIVGRLRPIMLNGMWRAEGPRSRLYPVESIVDTVGNSQDSIVTAINVLRSLVGLPLKTFPPIDTAPKLHAKPATLLHGTSFDISLKIRRQGMVPQIGRFTATAHSEAAALIYASTSRDLHRVVAAAYVASHHPQTDAGFFETAAIIVLPNDGKWYKASASRDDPRGTEAGDYYRSEPIMPTRILAGDDLRRFFIKLGKMPSDYVSFMT